ncbi:MAG: protein translocase subunit SecF [Deltaproteobacteria bacterium]|nr:protein translocase subunit SecF [Deltaproteobacteria bacterium]
MFSIIPPNTKFDFMGKAGHWAMISLVAFLLSLVIVFVVPAVAPGYGLKLGLDFTGGNEVLVGFKKQVTAAQVREVLTKLNLGDTSVQSFGNDGDYLVRVQRSEALAPEDVASFEKAFADRYGPRFKPPIAYNKEIGTVIEVEFAVSASVATAVGSDLGPDALSSFVGSLGRKTTSAKKIGRPDQARFAIAIEGIDGVVVKGLQALDPDALAKRVEFVGPTVGKQLRDDGILAVLYALLCILIYIALRFDFFYSPGAVICLFHDAFVTTAVLALVGREFTLTTIAGLLTLVGYSINDTIIVFDRIRESVGKAQGRALSDVINRSINETLGRTVMTSSTVILACVCLCIFGYGTVLFEFGLILGIGVVLGTYSSIFVASPIFMWLREKYAPTIVEHKEVGHL